MNWLDEMRRRDQLLDWREQGLLTSAQLQQALAPEHPHPSGRHWRLALDRLLAGYGSLLLALGVIFFFAFNWDELHRLYKLALAVVALTGFAALTFTVPRGSVLYRAGAFGAALTTGGLLALVGQIYQTGADIWQLFAAWAALMLPWVLISGSVACWALFWLVFNLALGRYYVFESDWPFGAAGLMALALGNLGLLLIFELLSRYLLRREGRSLPRLAALGMVSALSLGVAISWWELGYGALQVLFGLVYLLGIPIYLRLQRDTLVLALLLYALVGAAASALASLMHRVLGVEGFGLFNLLGLFVLLASAAVSVWLHRLYREENA